MDSPGASPLIAVSTEPPSEEKTRLQGHWLIIARIVWVVLVALSLGLFVMALFASFGLITLGVAFSPQLIILYIFAGQHAPWRTLFLIVNVLGWGSVVLFFYLFPNGRFFPRWMVWLALCSLAFQVSHSLPPNSFFSVEYWPPLVQACVVLALVLSVMYSQLYRYRHLSNQIERQQAKWVVFGIVLSSLTMAMLFLPPLFFPFLTQPGLSRSLYAFMSGCLFLLALNMIPLAIGVAVLRYRLWDIDLIINRALVYGILTISVVGFYMLVVVSLEMLLQAQGNVVISLLATGFIAVLFQPLRDRLQRAVNRLIYRERDDPYRVLSRLGQRLEATLAPEAVLPTIVETVAQALKLPYAAITLKQDDDFTLAATYGTAQTDLLRLPLVYQAEPVGELLLAPRMPGETFSSGDRKLLEDLAHQVGVAAHTVRLTDDLKQLTIDLQHSRERLVTAHEEERRRLSRDLHDGLGPQLAGLTLKLETARNRLTHDALADMLLSDLITRTQATVADIRRLVYALRPPALDELGLLPALREQALQYSEQRDNGLHVILETPEYLPELSAAIEVAFYRIVQEALTNVVRHARARHCTIRLTLNEMAGLITLEVRDDGAGMTPAHKQGVGLTSMRERAEELGGAWTMQPLPTGGTSVIVQLPIRLPSPTETMERQSRSLLPEEDD